MSRDDRMGWTVASVLAMLIIFTLWATADDNEQAAEARTYCEMVAIWKQDAAKGIPHAQRNGWPPYRGEGVNCD